MSCYVQNSEGGDSTDSSIDWQAGSLGSINTRTPTRSNVSTCKPRYVENAQPLSAKTMQQLCQTDWHRHTITKILFCKHIVFVVNKEVCQWGRVSPAGICVTAKKRHMCYREIRRGERGRERKMAIESKKKCWMEWWEEQFGYQKHTGTVS